MVDDLNSFGKLKCNLHWENTLQKKGLGTTFITMTTSSNTLKPMTSWQLLHKVYVVVNVKSLCTWQDIFQFLLTWQKWPWLLGVLFPTRYYFTFFWQNTTPCFVGSLVWLCQTHRSKLALCMLISLPIFFPSDSRQGLMGVWTNVYTFYARSFILAGPVINNPGYNIQSFGK